MNLVQRFESANGPAALGPYSPAVKLGDFVYLSGQLGMDKDGNLPESVEDQTKASMKNIGYLLAEMNLSYRHIVKTTVYVTDLNDFNAVNEIYGTFFTEGVYPARSCVQVAALPKGAKVEIECFAIDTLAYERQIAAQQAGGGCSGSCDGCGGCQ